MCSFDRIILEIGGAALAPAAGIVCLPIALFAILIKGVQEIFYNYMLGLERKEYTNYDAEKTLTQKDIRWLKLERDYLDARDDRILYTLTARTAAKLLIPILGYVWVTRYSSHDLLPSFRLEGRDAKWCTWYIDLLEGRLQKNSAHYALGINLSHQD